MRTASHSQRIVPLPASRQKLCAGADRLADSIRPTLGPNARTVVVEAVRDLSPLEILDDGGTIARRMVPLGDRMRIWAPCCCARACGRCTKRLVTARHGRGHFQSIVRAGRRLLAAGSMPPICGPNSRGGPDGADRAARAGAATDGQRRSDVARWLSAMMRRWPTCWGRSSTSLEAMAM